MEQEEQERRRREGIERAKAEGKYKGRRPTLPPETERRVWLMFLHGHRNIAELARRFKVSRGVVYRVIARWKAAHGYHLNGQ